MSDGDSDSLTSSSNAQVELERTPDIVNSDLSRPNSPQPDPSFLDDDFHEQDDSTSIYTYSYNSTWSSNYTMSNLEGPGRLLGNLLSRAGSSLERRLGKIAKKRADRRAFLQSLARAEADLSLHNLFPMILESEDMINKERACNILLGYARYVAPYLHPSEHYSRPSRW